MAMGIPVTVKLNQDVTGDPFNPRNGRKLFSLVAEGPCGFDPPPDSGDWALLLKID
jgi:hypothetical protein